MRSMLFHRYIQVPKEKEMVYTKLNQCTSTDRKTKYNAWVVVNKVSREPFQCRYDGKKTLL